MPANFDKCVKNGGKVRTKKLSRGRYQHVCYIDGKVYKGYIKHRKKIEDRMKKATGN